MQIQTAVLVTCLLAFASAVSSHKAAVLTVDNNPGAVAMYKNLGDAVAAAKDGDTILIAGSKTEYNPQTIYKRLNLVGSGYWLQENSIPGLNKEPVRFSGTGFGHQAEGSTLTGISIRDFVQIYGAVTFDRCYLPRVLSDVQYTVRRSVIYAHIAIPKAGTVLLNSVFEGPVELGEGVSASHCIFRAVGETWTAASSSILNSIFSPVGPAPTAAEFSANVKGSVTYSMAIGGNYLPGGDSANINGVAGIADVFLLNGSPDGGWQLKPESPAAAKGFDGVDLGIFGGSAPYIVSGVPSRPRITRLVVPGLANSATGLKFEVSAQSF